MATKKEPTPDDASVKPNREQRRREKFGKAGKVSQHDPLDPWPQSEANPAMRDAAADQSVHATRAEPEVTDETGPGTGSTTEPADPAADPKS